MCFGSVRRCWSSSRTWWRSGTSIIRSSDWRRSCVRGTSSEHQSKVGQSGLLWIRSLKPPGPSCDSNQGPSDPTVLLPWMVLWLVRERNKEARHHQRPSEWVPNLFANFNTVFQSSDLVWLLIFLSPYCRMFNWGVERRRGEWRSGRKWKRRKGTQGRRRGRGRGANSWCRGALKSEKGDWKHRPSDLSFYLQLGKTAKNV